jgi:adhesin transport system membrane fusion protein
VTIGGLLVWSAYSNVDEVTHAEGRVIPSSHMQVIQNMEGGIVKSINVKQGDVVEKDDVVLSMESVQFSSELDSKRQQVLSLMAKEARLRAEVYDTPLSFTKEFSAMASHYVSTETSEYESRKRRLNADLALLESQVQSGQQELDIVRKLTERGLEPQIELVRTQARVDEAKNKMESMRRQFKSDSATELSRVVLELNPMRQTLPAFADKVNRTQIKAPMKGVVNRVMVNTIGGVIKPGEPVVEIVPYEDNLVVEAQIRPQDIGFIHLGQSANVKFTAYDYSIFGSLKGTVTNISPDAVSKEERGQVNYYYVARIETSTKAIKSLEKNLPIIPGMQAQVDIITGNKSVLSYLLKPLIGVKENAFRER